MKVPAVLLAALLSACASVPAAIAPGEFPLLPPASYGRSVQLQQVLHAAYGGNEGSLQCVVDIGPERVLVVGLTAAGQRVFRISWDGTRIEAERSPMAPDAIQPQRILSDLQLALWPLAALQSAAGEDWQVSEPRPGVRRLRQGGAIVSEVHDAGGGRLWLVSLRHGYTLDVTSTELAP